MNSNQPPTPQLPFSPDMLSAMLSNPEIQGKLGSVLAALSQGAGAPPVPTNDQPNETAKPAPVASSPSQASSDPLVALLSSPTLLQNLPQILSTVTPLLSSLSPSTPPPSNQNTVRKPAELRNNLLLALKPFLSSDRCDAIDSIIRISALGNVFSQLK